MKPFLIIVSFTVYMALYVFWVLVAISVVLSIFGAM